MGTEGTVQTVRVKKSARPWSGFFLGLVLGIAIAVVLQQAGVWPVDRLLLFGSAGLFALIGIIISGAGRERVGAFSSVVPLVLAVALIGFGATGLGSINENGQLNGGCTVEAASDIDSTVVTDTSSQEPFQVDPDGGLSWVATSPGPITNHFWEIYVDVGGFPVNVASNDEVEPNTAGDTEKSGEVTDLSAYIQEVSDTSGLELDGVFEVGGSIDGEGGACDGFGFVELIAEPLSTLISQIAAGVGLLALIGLLALAFNRTREAAVMPDQVPVEDTTGAVGAARAVEVDETGPTAAGGGAHIRPDDGDAEDLPVPPDEGRSGEQEET